MLVCAICGSRFTVSGINRSRRYICGSHTNGAEHACSNGIHVALDLVEDRILTRTVEQLLSPEAVALAQKEMRRIARERQAGATPAPKKHNAQVARLDRQVEELERLLKDGVLSEAVAASAIDTARAERTALLSAADGSASKAIERVVTMLPKAAETYRQTVAEMRTVLRDARRIHRARAALRELLGESIPLAPAASGDYLVAEIAFNPLVLLKAAGGELWDGSGGRI